MKKFALIGLAGFIAPRHLKAIKASGHVLVAAMDKADNVGVIDQYFPEAHFFTEMERFDRYLEKQKLNGEGIDYLVVCTPNYLHDAHIRFGLKHGADVICEKPLALNTWNLDSLKKVENETGKKVYSLLQLRYHPDIIQLKNNIDQSDENKKHEVDLTYIASRGNWYYAGWKGDEQKSGGIATNIGIHFFDMLIWIFGSLVNSTVHIYAHDRASGYLELEKANVRWFLSINKDTLPDSIKSAEVRTYRSVKVDGTELEFSNGFEDLHNLAYRDILSGNGTGIDDSKAGIMVTQAIREQSPVGMKGEYHELAKLPLQKHPFF